MPKQIENNSAMPLTRTKSLLIGGLLIGVSLAGGGYGYLHWTIQSSLDEHSTIAQQAHPHPGDDLAALIAYLESDSHSPREKNQAVWALGQLRDSRALPALERYYTGQPCNHDEFICQRELAKAIELCQGQAPNILFIKARQQAE